MPVLRSGARRAKGAAKPQTNPTVPATRTRRIRATARRRGAPAAKNTIRNNNNGKKQRQPANDNVGLAAEEVVAPAQQGNIKGLETEKEELGEKPMDAYDDGGKSDDNEDESGTVPLPDKVRISCRFKLCFQFFISSFMIMCVCL